MKGQMEGEKGRKEGRMGILFKKEEIEIKKLEHINISFKKSLGFHTQSLVKVPPAMTLLSLHYDLNESFINKDHLNCRLV